MDYSAINKITYDDLAKEYEERVNSLTAVTKRGINYFAKYVNPNGSVLDIGCAVGLAISVLKEKGFKVSGIEISPKMVKFAKKRNPGTDIITGDFLETEYNKKFDAVLAYAFIHLFPKAKIPEIFNKIKSVLSPGGVVLISSTESSVSKEGWEIKTDFNKKRKRFRKFWTEKELTNTIKEAGFKKLALKKFKDPFGKVWMDFIAQYNYK